MTRSSPTPPLRRTSIAAALALAAALFAATAPAAFAAGPATASLTVSFQGIKTTNGSIEVSVTASPEAYAGKAPAAGQAIVAVNGPAVTATFTGLEPGTYAIRAFHDLNGDGKLNTNPFGIPTEPYAFSNNARGTMGPAPWGAAAFALKAGENRQAIDID